MTDEMRQKVVVMEEKLAIECSDLRKLIEDKVSEVKHDHKQTSLVVMST